MFLKVRIPAMIIFIFSVVMVLSACSSDKKAVKKPLTEKQVIQKAWQKSEKLKKIAPVHYELKETMIHAESEKTVDYVSDKQFHFISKSRDIGEKELYSNEEVYNLKDRHYSIRHHEDDPGKWSVGSYTRSFKESHLEQLTTTGKIEELTGKYYLKRFNQAPPKIVKMKEQEKSYQIELIVTHPETIKNLMQDYLKHFDDVINPQTIFFKRYHTVLNIDKKTFAVQSVKHEVLFQREVRNLDTGKTRLADLSYHSRLQFHPFNKITVPAETMKQIKTDNPYNPFLFPIK